MVAVAMTVNTGLSEGGIKKTKRLGVLMCVCIPSTSSSLALLTRQTQSVVQKESWKWLWSSLPVNVVLTVGGSSQHWREGGLAMDPLLSPQGSSDVVVSIIR